MFASVMADKDPNSIDFSSLKEILSQIDDVMGNTIRGVAGFLRKNLLFLIVATSIGIGWGAAQIYFNKPVYTFEMTVYHGDLEKKTFSDLIDKLDVVARKNMYNELSGLLNLPVAVVKEIKSIHTETIDGKPLSKNYSSEKEHPFRIRVALSSPVIWQNVAESVKNFILNQRFMQKLMKINHERVEKEIVFLENELNQLNQLKQNINLILAKGMMPNDISLLKTLDVPGIYQKTLELYKEKERALNFLAFDEGVTIINQTASVNVPYHESYFRVLIKKWFLTMAIALIMLYVVRKMR